MKVFIVLSSVLALACANAYYGDAGHGYGGHGYGHGQLLVAPTHKVIAAPLVAHVQPVHTGYSNSYRQQDSWGNYKFGYDEQHATGGTSRKEEGDSHGNKVGSYSLNVGDGRKRVVKYVADGHGFRASIQTNEPGVVAKAPASVELSTPHGHSYSPNYGHDDSYSHGPVYASHSAPVYSHAAPIVHAPVAYGPVSHGYGGSYGSHGGYSGYGAHGY